MTGVSIEIAVDDKAIQAAFTRLVSAMGDTTPVMAATGTGLVASTTRRFVSQSGSGGGRWAANSPGYAAIKRNRRVLTESGVQVGFKRLLQHLKAGGCDTRCESFSKGMRQKVALAGALVHDPKLIILDEPLTGLDAGSARQVKTVLLERVRQGCTVIMTTHILEVAERMAERVGVIAAGRLIAEGTLDELRRHSGMGQSSLEDIFLDLVSAPEAAA